MEIITTQNAPGAIGPYSQGYIAGNFVYTSGQIPVDPQTGEIPEGIAAQAERSCANVGAILEAAGTDFTKVFKKYKNTTALTNGSAILNIIINRPAPSTSAAS